MLNILIKQPIHILQSLSLAAKLKIAFILLTLYAYTSEQIYQLLPQWETRYSINSSQAAYLLTSGYILSVLLFTPLIFKRLIPKEKRISIFYTQSLSLKNVIFLSLYFFIKYLFIFMLFFLPFISALLFTTPLSAIYNLIVAAAVTLIYFLIYFSYAAGNRTYKTSADIKTFIHTAVFILANGINIYYFQFELPVNLVLIFAGAAIAYYRLRRIEYPDLIAIFPPFLKKKRTAGNLLRFKTSKKPITSPLGILIGKELAGLWRSPAYRLGKTISLLLYLLILFLIEIKFSVHRELLISLISIIFIWMHYSSHFKRKYSGEDPDWYFHTLPLNGYRVWISKFTAEFIPVIIIIIIHTAAFYLNHISPRETFAFTLILIIFSLAALMIKLNFQILFYDNMRLAGYAYHLNLIFIIVMCVNYRFVGPLISLILLISYFYKSYRFFKG